MDTIATITVYDEEDIAKPAIAAAFEELHRLEKIFSYTDPDSELSYINAAAYEESVLGSDEMNGMIYLGQRMSAWTEGAFDISLGGLIDGSFNGDLSDLGYENILMDPKKLHDDGKISFDNKHIKLHFGAIAKGCAVEEMSEILTEHGVISAIIDIGGEIGVIGESRRKDGLWKVAIESPFNDSEIAATLTVKDGAGVATSGSYKRGEHIFDRTTGRPANTELASVTVVSDNAALSDVLSTAFFVMGEGKAVEFAKQEEHYCVVFVNKEGKVTDYHFDNNDSCYCSDFIGSTPVN